MARTIGFLGPLGTYSEEAALLYDLSADRPYPTITAVGVAKPIAHGHATTNTAILLFIHSLKSYSKNI